MRKATLLLFFALIAGGAALQAQIPNYSFENFTGTGMKMKPQSWDTLGGNVWKETMINYKVSNGTSTEDRSRGAYWGSSFVGMRTGTFKRNDTTFASPAVISTSYADSNSYNYFQIYLGYLPGTASGGVTERWAVALNLTKWNTDSMRRDTIMTGIWYPSAQNAGIEPWKLYALDLTKNYTSTGGTPDSAHVRIISSIGLNGTFNLNTTLYADNLKFAMDMPVGVEEYLFSQSAEISDVLVYPNPSASTVNFKYTTTKSDYVTLKIFDITGREVKTVVNQTIGAGEHVAKMDVSNLTNGLYIYRLQAGTHTSTGRVQVAH